VGLCLFDALNEFLRDLKTHLLHDVAGLALTCPAETVDTPPRGARKRIHENLREGIRPRGVALYNY
jgi:hypothetical protein